MKTEDFERLKELIEKEGFELHVTDMDKDQIAMIVQKKDLWEGVEYFQIDGLKPVLKIERNMHGYLLSVCGFGISKDSCIPSTEEEYIEYLKKEAFERYGEIKEDEKFIEPIGNEDFLYLGKDKNPNIEWDYEKKTDRLFYYSLVLYEKGKWAERVKERIEVDFYDYGFANGGIMSLRFKVKNGNVKGECFHEIGKYLAKQLENYLNDESKSL